MNLRTLFLAAAAASPLPSAAQSIITVTSDSGASNVMDACVLRDAITYANSGVPTGGCGAATTIAAGSHASAPNYNPGNVIELPPQSTITLTAVDDLDRLVGLPVVSSPLIIYGNGSTIRRSSTFDCVIDGDLPSHGDYKPLPPTEVATAETVKAEQDAHLTAVKEALKNGADANDELGNAIVAADLPRVTWLLDHGANANTRFNDGYTPLANATRFGFNAIAAYLAEHKADPNQADISHWTPLMYAAWNDDPEQVRMLIAHGAKVDLADEEGLSPLAIAAQNGKAKSAAALIDGGANVNLGVGKAGYTPLMLAASAGSLDIADLLLKRGAKVNAKNAGGVTALMIVAAKNQPKVAARLLAAGADVTATSQDGRTALKIAQSNNSEAVLKLLQAGDKRSGS